MPQKADKCQPLWGWWVVCEPSVRRKPEKNKAIEKPILKLLFILLLFFFPSYGITSPRQDGAERPIMVVGQE